MAEPRRITTSSGVRYQADIRIKGYQRRTKLFSKRRDAMVWRDKVTTDILEGRVDAAQLAADKTVSDIIDKFLTEMVDSNYKSDQYKRDLKHRLTYWRGCIGGYQLCNLNASLLTQQRTKMLQANTRSPSTINRYLSALSSVINKAVNEWQYMEYNPIKSLKTLREPNGRTRWLDEHERQRLFDVAQRITSKPLYELIVLAIATGARKSELLGIKKSNVLVAQNKIIIEDTKNRSNRSLYVDGYPLELVQQLLKAQPRKTYLFASRKGDVPITIDKEWRRIVKQSRLKNFRFHDLRHTAAAYLAMNGATLNEIAELLGHKTFNMTKRYAHIADSHLKEVSAKVQGRVFGVKE